jgi:hypothetical protein
MAAARTAEFATAETSEPIVIPSARLISDVATLADVSTFSPNGAITPTAVANTMIQPKKREYLGTKRINRCINPVANKVIIAAPSA